MGRGGPEGCGGALGLRAFVVARKISDGLRTVLRFVVLFVGSSGNDALRFARMGMFYRKNIYRWEQWFRVVIGIAAAGLALYLAPGQMLGYGIAAAGLGLAVTGAFGFCPACAMIGRRPKDLP